MNSTDTKCKHAFITGLVHQLKNNRYNTDNNKDKNTVCWNVHCKVKGKFKCLFWQSCQKRLEPLVDVAFVTVLLYKYKYSFYPALRGKGPFSGETQNNTLCPPDNNVTSS